MNTIALPNVVFSMECPFSGEQVLNRLREELNGNLSDLDDDFGLGLTLDLYLENLVRHGVLRQEGSLFHFRALRSNSKRTQGDTHAPS